MKGSIRERSRGVYGPVVDATVNRNEPWVQTQQTITLADLLANYVPGSYPQPWSWDDEEKEILSRECLCCGVPGHYQRQLEAHIMSHGLGEGGVCLSPDGVVWDGHHRIVAARRLGIYTIPLESKEESVERWVRDHGHVDWVDRKKGDRLSWEQEWRKRWGADG